MSRYASPRLYLRWDRNDRLRALKMLAWVVYTSEGIRSVAALEARVAKLCEPVMQIVLGEDGVTLDVIRAETLAQQGVELTAVRLHQRADKAQRYNELNEFAEAVVAAHARLVATPTNLSGNDEMLNDDQLETKKGVVTA